MANDDMIAARGGLLPVEYPYGNFRKNYYKLTTSTVAVYLGQPMDMDANGQVVPATASTGGTNFMIGPVVGFADENMNALPTDTLVLTAGPYIQAAKNAYVCIADDPDQLFVIQAATDTAITTANMGDTTTWTYRSSSGNTTTGFCTAELSGTQCSTTGSGALQILGLYPVKNSDGSTNAVGNYAKVRVRILNHRFGMRPTIAGLGAV